MNKMLDSGSIAEMNGEPEAGRKNWLITGIGVVSALAMTSCCILPLALISVGISGVFIGQLGALYQYHWYFLTFAVVALGYGFYKAYAPVNSKACADGTCARPVNRTVMRTILWVSLAIVIIATVFPYFAPSFLNPF